MKVYILFTITNEHPGTKEFVRLFWEEPTLLQLKDYDYSFSEYKNMFQKSVRGWGYYLLQSFEKNELEVKPIYKDVIDYLNKKTDSAFRYAKAHQRIIEARVKEKFTLEDFKAVIDVKASQWKGSNMQIYLRPATLFQASKMDGYLQESKMIIPKSNDEKTTAERASDTVQKFFSGS